MSSYLSKGLVAVGFLAAVGVTSLACAGPAKVEKAADGNTLTAEQCIDNNSTKGSVKPFEDALITAGIVDTDLDKITITSGMCEEIVARTPGGSPVERAVAVGNLTQELRIVENSMEDASHGDVDGDGMVNAKDKSIATSASFAASRAARQTMTGATEEGSTDGGISKLDVQPAAYLAQQETTSVSTQQATSESTTGSASPSPSASAASSASAQSSASATTSASAQSSATASSAAGGKAQSVGTSSRDKAQNNASRAARGAGAGPKAAAGGGQCAATVALVHVTLHVIRGYITFKTPARELRWNEHDEAGLVVAPKALGPIKQLKRVVRQAAGPGKVEANCLQLGDQIEPNMISDDDGLDIKWLTTDHKQTIFGRRSNTWRWKIGASQPGSHVLILNLKGYVYTRSEGGRTLPFEEPPFDYTIHVDATRWALFTDFLSHRSPVLVPIFLTMLTAIIIPLVVYWWRRRNQPGEPRGRSGGTPRNGGWV